MHPPRTVQAPATTLAAVASAAALGLPALDALGVLSPALDEVSFAAWGSLASIAVLSLPSGAREPRERDRRATVLAAGVLAPVLALAAVSDARAGAPLGAALARVTVGLVLALLLFASATRSRARDRAGIHLVAWCVVVLAAPALVVALELAGGAGSPPAAVESAASFSPLAWAAHELALGSRERWSDVASSGWRPAVGAALVALVSFGPAGERTR